MNVIINAKSASKYDAIKNALTKHDNICKKLLSSDEQKYVAEISDKFDVNCDATILTILNKNYGFTAQDLRTFWDDVRNLQKSELEANYDAASYGYVSQVQALKDELGIDIIAWNQEEV